MTVLNPSTSKNRGARLLAAALLAGCALAPLAQAEEAAPADPLQGQEEREAMRPEKAARHIEKRIARLVPDATPEQKARLQAIAKSAMADLAPLRAGQSAARAESRKLLTQPAIDRAAIERARAARMQVAEARSKRMSQAWADAAEVLTPAQRAKLAERLAARHARHQAGPAS